MRTMKEHPRGKIKGDWEISPEEIKQYAIGRMEAYKIAKEINEKLDPKDFIVKKRARVIAVYHGDRSYLEFHSACFREISEDFMAVFTEHHGYHVYHVDDVDWIREWLSPKCLYYNTNL